MIKEVYSIFDVKSKVYSNPTLSIARGDIEREWIDIVNEPDNKFNRHPEDFILYKLGTFDDCAGVYDCLDTPEIIARAIDVWKGDPEVTKVVEEVKESLAG